MNRQARRAALAMRVVAATAWGYQPELPLVHYEADRPPSSNQRKRRLNARRAASHPASRKRGRHG